MPCEICAAQFTVFKRKRSCADCKRPFCSSCLEKKNGKILCVKCLIFASNPSKLELLKLKTKDLIFFLQSKHVSTSGIVEKEELVNLVLYQIRIGQPQTTPGSQTTPNSDFEGYTNSFDQIKNTCQNFITSFTDKISSDLHKTTCFTPPQQKENVHSTQPRPNQSTPQTNTPYVPEFQRPSAPTAPPPQPQNKQTRNLEVNSNASNVSSATTSPMFSHQNVSSAGSSRLVSPGNHVNLTMQDGCECTDDEGEEQAIGGVEEKQNVMVDEVMPGPSGCSSSSGTTSSNKPVKRSTSNDSSSFEDLAIGATSSDETWQFVDKTENADNNHPNKTPEMSQSAAQTSQHAKITRRRSDSSILLNLPKSKSIIQIDPSLEASTVKKLKISCQKCGKAKSSIKKEIAKLRSQLEASNKTEEEVNARVYEFLNYLEAKSRSSDLTDSEESHASQVCGTEIPVSMSNDEIQESVFDENFGIHVYGSEADEQAANSNAKRFMQLDDISSSEELELLTVKQLKEILMLNRVDFKGCCEKNELKERVLRLWQHHMAAPAPDKISSEELCKICFDAPIECVLLECGHMATCLNCGKTMNECPICRQYIVRVVRFFKS